MLQAWVPDFSNAFHRWCVQAVGATTVTPAGKEVKAASFVWRHWTLLALCVSLLAFVTLLWSDIFGDAPKQNCLAMLVFVSMLWASEAIPLYTTSMMVAPLAVLLRVMVDTSGDEPRRMTAQVCTQP